MFISLNGCGTSTSSEIKIDDNVSVEPTQMIVSSKFDMNDNKFGDGSEPTAGWLHALLVLKVTNNGEKNIHLTKRILHLQMKTEKFQEIFI